MLKNQSLIVDKETGVEWRVERRTRGQDIDNGPTSKPTQAWVLVLTNKQGHRRFVPEGRITEYFETAS